MLTNVFHVIPSDVAAFLKLEISASFGLIFATSKFVLFLLLIDKCFKLKILFSLAPSIFFLSSSIQLGFKEKSNESRAGLCNGAKWK